MKNRVILLGRVGKDPDVKKFSNGTTAVNFSVATNDGYYDKNTGEWIDKTEWHNIQILGKAAEIAETKIKKGLMVFIEGKVKTRSYGEGSEKRYITEIVLSDFNDSFKIIHEKKNDQGKEQETPF